MKALHVIPIAVLLSMMLACESGGGGDAVDVLGETPPLEAPDDQPSNGQQVLREPDVIDAPTGEPAETRSYSFELLPAGDAIRLNGVGDVIGVSDDPQGSWLYSDGMTREIGFTRVNSVPAEASHTSTPASINATQVIGATSSSWSEVDADTGEFHHLTRSTAWLYLAGITIELGLTDQGDSSLATGQNRSGQVIGFSGPDDDICFKGIDDDTIRFPFEPCEIDQASWRLAWLYSDGNYQMIGLTDGQHTSEGGHRSNLPRFINGNGDATGIARRFDDNAVEAGHTLNSCWYYSAGTTYLIGKIDEQTDATCSVSKINESAQVIGASGLEVFPYTSSAWLYSAGSTINIGLTDSAHTAVNGSRWAEASELNNAGQAAGRSRHYAAGDDSSSFSAWFYEQGSTRDISLSGQEYTRFDGGRYSDVVAINEAGQVLGHAVRYDPASSVEDENLGQTAWLYSNGSHIKLGINDAEHTGIDGTRYSKAISLNEKGQVAGHSLFYSPNLNLNPCGGLEFFCGARTAWLYDTGQDKIFRVILSTRSDGFAFSDIISLGEDGTLRGYYMDFDNNNDTFAWRIFTFSVESGLQAAIIDGMEELELTLPTLENDRGYFVSGGAVFSPLPDEAE